MAAFTDGWNVSESGSTGFICQALVGKSEFAPPGERAFNVGKLIVNSGHKVVLLRDFWGIVEQPF